MFAFAEVGVLNLGAVQEFRGKTFENDMPILEDVATVGDLKGKVGVLFDHEHGDALRVNRLNGLENAVDE